MIEKEGLRLANDDDRDGQRDDEHSADAASRTDHLPCNNVVGGISNSNSNSNSHDSVYGAVIIAVHCHCESSPGSSDECSTQRQVAPADLWTKPISLSQ